MSLRLKPRDPTSAPVASYGFEKPNKTLTLNRMYTAALNTLLSKKALGMIIAVLVFYTVFDVLHGPTPASDIVSREDLKEDNDTHERPVKLYVYDLPYRFTYGIIEHHHLSHSNRTVEDVTQLPYPAHQHMAEWFIFKDLLKPDSERVGSPVIRVYDPDEAELFYVPFFSSLSMIVTRLRYSEGSGREAYSDEKTQQDLITWLEGQEYWRRNYGRDHVTVASDPNAYHHVIEKVKNCTMLLAGFGRLRVDQGSLVKDVVVPYAHRVSSYAGKVGVNIRPTLLFFMGARYRKEGGKIRDLLFDILEKEDGVVMKEGTQSKDDRRTFSRGVYTSKFCLNPAGDTSTSCRLFDSIVSLCIPVIVSDEVELPFEDIIDYTKIAIFVATEEALKPGYLVSLLRTIPDEEIIEYQEHLRQVKPYFDFRSETLNQIWREVNHKLPFIKLMINRQRRLVSRRYLNKPGCSCSNQTIDITNAI